MVLLIGVIGRVQEHGVTVHHRFFIVCREPGPAAVAEIDNLSLGTVKRQQNTIAAGLAFGISFHFSHHVMKGIRDINPNGERKP
jgi:hypothetical protein